VAAGPGDELVVGAGDHPYQRLAHDPGKDGQPPVVFAFEDGARVATLDLGQQQEGVRGPDGITLRSPAYDYLRIWAEAKRIRVEGARGGSWDIFGATDISILGGRSGPKKSAAGVVAVARVAGGSLNNVFTQAENILIDRHEFAEIGTTDAVLYHVEALFIRGGKNITVRRCRFRANEVYNIFVQIAPNQKLEGCLIEQNWFDAARTATGGRRNTSVVFDSDETLATVSDVVIRNNSCAKDAAIGAPRGSLVEGNLFQNDGPKPEVTYRGNYFVPFSAGAAYQSLPGDGNVKVAGFGYVDELAVDFRLTETSPVFAERAVYEAAAADAEPEPEPEPEPPSEVEVALSHLAKANWARANPGEHDRVAAYLRGGVRPPEYELGDSRSDGVETWFGRALLHLGDAVRG
jgi:hypothetical protein